MKLKDYMYLIAGVPAILTGGVQAVSLEEVIVTAQKREQSLQDVPMAVSTITSGDMEKMGVFRPGDLANVVPNLNVTAPHLAAAPNFNMRGISVGNEYSYNQASPIGVYVNEIYMSARFTHGANLFDLERSEVLRGPQGTLYGRNTTGGAINFITRDPSLEGGTQGYITAGIGNRGYGNTELAVETTLADNWGLRVAGRYSEVDGYMENLSPGGEDGHGGHGDAARLSLRYSGEDADIVFRAYASEEKSGGTGVIALGSGPNQANILTTYCRCNGNNGAPLNDREFHSNRTQDAEVDAWGANLTVKYAINENLELTSITAYDDASIDQPQFDWSASPVAIGWGDWLTDNEQVQQDIRLSYSFDRGNLIVGAYYGWDETVTDNHNSFYEELPADFLVVAGFPPVIAHNYYEQERTSNAVYAHGSYELSDRLTLTAGMRYTKDKFEYNNALAYLEYNVPSHVLDTLGAGAIGDGIFGMVPIGSHLNPSVAFWGAFADQTVYVPTIPGDGLRTLPPAFQNTAPTSRYPNQSGKTNKVTGTLILDYQFSTDVMGYVSFSRGYRAGTMNGGGYLDSSQISFVDPEELDAYEVGFKSRFADNRVQLNAAAFLYDYTNNQVQNIIGVTSFLENAGKSEIKGLEVELAAMVSDDLQLNVNLGYQDATYDELALEAGGIDYDLSGNRMMNAPRKNVTVSADWTLWRNDIGSLIFTPTFNYTGHQYFSPFNEVAGNQKLQEDSYWLTSAQLVWDTEDYTVRLWGRNLTDKTYMIYGIDIRSGFDVDYFVRGEPKSYGLDVTFRF